MSPVLAADLGEVLPPLAILVVAVVVIVVTVLASRASGRSPVPEPTGAVTRWQHAHGPALDAWTDAYDRRLAEAGGEDRPPAPVPAPVEEALEAAADACPDESLAEALRAMQAAGRSALVAAVADRGHVQEEQARYERTVVAARALLGAVLRDTST